VEAPGQLPSLPHPIKTGPARTSDHSTTLASLTLLYRIVFCLHAVKLIFSSATKTRSAYVNVARAGEIRRVVFRYLELLANALISLRLCNAILFCMTHSTCFYLKNLQIAA